MLAINANDKKYIEAKNYWLVNTPEQRMLAGRFHMESFLSRYVALAGKLHYGDNIYTKEQKTALRGLPHDQESSINFDLFLQTKLDLTPKLLRFKNAGFRRRQNCTGIFTYQLNKRSLNAMYIKRLIMKDGVQTKPLENV